MKGGIKNSLLRRMLIRKTDFFEFRSWLMSLGWQEQPRKLEHEILRMRHNTWEIGARGPLLIYGDLNDDYFITFGVSRDVFKIFLRDKKHGHSHQTTRPLPDVAPTPSISKTNILTNDSPVRLQTTRKLPHGVPSLAGTRFGRFLVVGWSEEHKNSWVVKCDCGIYTTRRTKAVRNPTNNDDKCERCRRIAYAINRREFDLSQDDSQAK